MLDRTAEGGCLYGVQILLEQTLRVPEADWGAKGSAVTAEGGPPSGQPARCRRYRL